MTEGLAGDLDLGAWVEDWASRYRGYDTALFDELGGSIALTADDLIRVVEWKNKRLWPARKRRAIEAFELCNPGRVTQVTELAFAAEDAEIALHLLSILPGVNSRTASAVLTVHDANRFTVMDVNALKTLRLEPVLGVQQAIADATTGLPGGDGWWRALYPEWLQITSDIARRSNRPLREIDHALMARGQTLR